MYSTCTILYCSCNVLYMYMYIILSRPRRSGGTSRLLQKAISDIHSRRGQRKRGSERRHKDQENVIGGILYIVFYGVC